MLFDLIPSNIKEAEVIERSANNHKYPTEPDVILRSEISFKGANYKVLAILGAGHEGVVYVTEGDYNWIIDIKTGRLIMIDPS